MTTKLFVHGVPETAAIWTELVEQLDTADDVGVLSLPGFGCGAPDGFANSMHEYEAWLRGEIEAAGGPVDLVGHDWGGILTTRLATEPPPTLRSWVTDAPAGLRPGFVWHDLAQVWLTEGAGEDFFAGMLADRGAAAELLTAFGLTLDHALALIGAVDQTMVDSILRLYRSSGGLGTDWVITGASPVPGLVLVAADDALGNATVSEQLATQLGASFVALESGGHFWPVESPAAAATAISAFWTTLD